MFRFWRSEGGNVAIIFTLAIVPIIGLVGAGVDYARHSNAQSQMQSAVDATALALSKLPADTPLGTVQTKAAQYFAANFNSTTVPDAAVQVVPGTKTLTVSATGTISTKMMIFASFNTLDLKASATVRWGQGKLRVAMALDTTGSMSDDNKIGTLKTATKNLLTKLQASAISDGDVEVAIIPFVDRVNVGPSNVNASWVDWTEYGTCSKKDSRGRWQETSDMTKKRCESNGGTWTLTTNKSNWKGCVIDRGAYDGPNPSTAGQGYDQRVDAPGSSSASKFPASQDDNCPKQMTGLTHDWTALTALVNSLNASGATNQPLGLVWAWQALVGGGPLTVPPKDPAYDYTEAIILLSDGLNTRNRWDGTGTPDQRQSVIDKIDNRMCSGANCSAGTCKNIKDHYAGKPFTLYTIQVNTGGDPKSTLLEKCASDPGKFYLLTSADQMISAFEDIGADLAKLHLSE